MKKKIKDWTLEELLNICLKYACEKCNNCPLDNNVCSYYFNVYQLCNTELDEEIEVKDDVD